ncbi:hypothetical protein AA103581_0165 [Gluconobacter wancherniae NBRC 103581]|nr:hypothetical protein AA103581_0165 [Gluconobacter wancherniae NBRC 103581]
MVAGLKRNDRHACLPQNTRLPRLRQCLSLRMRLPGAWMDTDSQDFSFGIQQRTTHRRIGSRRAKRFHSPRNSCTKSRTNMRQSQRIGK